MILNVSQLIWRSLCAGGSDCSNISILRGPVERPANEMRVSILSHRDWIAGILGPSARYLRVVAIENILKRACVFTYTVLYGDDSITIFLHNEANV